MLRSLRMLCLLPVIAAAGAPPPDLQAVRQQIGAVEQELQALPERPTPQQVQRVGFHSSFVGTPQAARWVQVDLGQPRAFDSLVIVPALFSPSKDGSGAYGMPPRFRLDVSDDESFATFQTLADHTEADLPLGLNPLFVATPAKARYVRFTAIRLAQQRLGRGFFALGEILVFAGPLDLAVGCRVTSSGAYETQPTWALANLTDGLSYLGVPLAPSDLRSNGWHSSIATRADDAKWVQLDLLEPTPLDELRFYPAHPPDFPERPGFGFPVRWRVEVSNEADFTHARLVLDATSSDYVNPADNAVVLPLHGQSARFCRITAIKLFERTQDFVFALAEVEAWSRGRNAALHATVTSNDETVTPMWRTEFLIDRRTSLGIIARWPDWLQSLLRRHTLETELAVLLQQREVLRNARQQIWLWAGGIAVLLATALAVTLHLRQRAQQRRSLMSLRQQIARDLHDEIGSSLGSISLISELAMRDGDAGALQEVHRLSREAAESMRGIIWLVRESGTPTLQRLVETMRQTAGSLLGSMDWELTTSESGDTISPSLDFHRHLFLFFKEAVHNIARHARAQQARMDLSWSAGTLRLCVQDDGVGFDPSAASTGSGLANLRHRGEALHGTLNITSHPGQGTTIILEAPLA